MVEDDRSLADVVVEGLRDVGMAVDVAHDGLDAATKIDLYPYDVVVLDRDLPGLSGDALCTTVTSSHPATMILMLTAADSPADRIAGLRLGADDYLTKPFSFAELILRIRALARRKPRTDHRVLSAAGVELNPLTRTATREGRTLELSNKEFAVLEALLEASPQVVSTEQLLQKAWDENTDPFSQAVKVTIGRLRRKLGEPPVIQTISGIGYRL